MKVGGQKLYKTVYWFMAIVKTQNDIPVWDKQVFDTFDEAECAWWSFPEDERTPITEGTDLII